MTSLFNPQFLLFVFAPLLFTTALVASIAWRKTRSHKHHDAAQGILATAVQSMPPERAEWGRAMSAELDHLDGTWARFRFAVGCAWVALFPPSPTAASPASFNTLKPCGIHCGMLSIALPPLALPFLFLVALVADVLFHGSGDSTSHAMPASLVAACLIMGLTLLLSGLPLGLVGWYRRERFLWLSALGPCLSVVFLGYLWLFLYLFAVGPNGD